MSSFRFKQFTIHQDQCAMKVCTDACLFGAWAADMISSGKIAPKNILDIGSGTGLLSLMLAQISSAEIDGVEIDDRAFHQSTENAAASSRLKNIRIYHCPITEFVTETKYDLVICNPPFYEDQLRSGNDQRNLAMHSTALSFIELADAIKTHLTQTGSAVVLLPYDRVNPFEKELNDKGLFITEKAHIAHSPAHPFFRSFLLISFIQQPVLESNILIKDSTDGYSEEFCRLLKDYYLAL